MKTFQPIYPSVLSVTMIFLLGMSLINSIRADDSIKKLILPGQSFLFEGRPAFILSPKSPAAHGSQPWVFYAPTLNGLPDEHEKWMHEKFTSAGIAVAGIDVGEGYGSPASRRLMTAFYRELVMKHRFAPKACLLGRSRGGLWVTSWANENPEKVAGIAGIYPVFDFRTYPGIKNAASAYELTVEQLTERQAEFNPIEQVSKLAKAGIPVFIIHGDDDKVVPLKENSAEVAAKYKAAGAEKLVNLMVIPGQGHNYWEGFFRCQELVDFTIHQSTIGAMSVAQ